MDDRGKCAELSTTSLGIHKSEDQMTTSSLIKPLAIAKLVFPASTFGNNHLYLDLLPRDNLLSKYKKKRKYYDTSSLRREERILVAKVNPTAYEIHEDGNNV